MQGSHVPMTSVLITAHAQLRLHQITTLAVTLTFRTETRDVQRQVSVIEGLAQHVQGMHTRPRLCSARIPSRLQQLPHAFLKQSLHALLP